MTASAAPVAAEELRLWSVTTLIKAGLGSGDALIGWAAKVTAERAYDRLPTLGSYKEAGDRDGAVKWLTDARWEKSGSAAARGTSVHGLIEAYAMGRRPDVPDEFLPYDVQVRKFLSEFKPEFEMAEAPVYHPELGYAGTLDLILRLGGKRLIVDAKTTDKAPDARSRPPYPEIALQLSAYSRATLVGTSPATMRSYSGRRYYVYDPALGYESLPEVDGALALIVSPYDYFVKAIRIDDEVWRAFAHVREAARWQLDTSKRVIGPEITPPYREASE